MIPNVDPLQHFDCQILRVERPQALLAYRPSFVGAYQTIFADPPYSERVFPNEAESVLALSLQTPGNITLLVVRGATQIIGFAMGVPLAARPDIYRDMGGLMPVSHTFYLSELGVLPAYRNQGLGALLLQERLQAIDTHVFSHAVLRTTANKDVSQRIYDAAGFEDIGVVQEVSARRMDGGVRTDRRLLLSKSL
jgi:ribosomal protein S18 acetylase RimI-like enzyme